jgi:hypothetical protein
MEENFGPCDACGWWHFVGDDEACMALRNTGDELDADPEDDFSNPYSQEA